MRGKLFNGIGSGPLENPNFHDWKKYSIHDENNIKGFFGDYRFLSNFERADVIHEFQVYLYSENAYQAAKIESQYRSVFAAIKPNISKKEWKNYPLLDASGAEWDKRKYDVMATIVFDKFYRNIELRKKLLETGNKYLEETNSWGDSYWGVDVNKGGQNNLGKILMKVREFWK